MSKKTSKKTKSRPKADDWAGRPLSPAAASGGSRPASKTDFRDVDEMRPEEMAALFGTIKGTLAIPHPPGTLTIAMIVKNEAKNIRAAMESFRPIAEEIIVYDTGSTDGTQGILDALAAEIAAAKPAEGAVKAPACRLTWYQGEWRNDFAWARNESIARATCSWILWMDADDRLPADQIANFLKLKTAPMDRAFGFQVINTQAGMPLGGRFMQLRMFPNHPAMRFRYRIHEQLLHSVAKLGLHVFYTETTLFHTGYEDPELKKAKALRNLLLLQEEPERIEAEPSLSMSVGDSYYIVGEWQKGIDAYKKTMAMPNCENINRDIYHELPCCIGQGSQKLGRLEEALTWFDQSIAMTPKKHEAFYHKAECLMEMGRHAEAEILYAKLVTMPVSFSTTSNQFDLIQIYSHFHLATFLHGRRDFPGTRKRLETLNAKYPQVVESWQLLGKCQLALGDMEGALKSWARAINLNPRALQELHGQRLALLKHMGRQEEFAESLAVAKDLFPQGRFPAWMARPALSLCMIVKNEKDNLPDCLASVKGLAEEIIVVDTGSTDGTQDIARSHGARVIQSGWQGDFSLARNLSLAEAQGRWIIWLDADDRLLEPDKAALRKLAEADPDAQPRAYGLMVKNSRDGGRTGSVFNQVRVFPNRPELRFRAPVHEQILPALEEAAIPVESPRSGSCIPAMPIPTSRAAKQVRNKAILEAQIQSGRRYHARYLLHARQRLPGSRQACGSRGLVPQVRGSRARGGQQPPYRRGRPSQGRRLPGRAGQVRRSPGHAGRRSRPCRSRSRGRPGQGAGGSGPRPGRGRPPLVRAPPRPQGIRHLHTRRFPAPQDPGPAVPGQILVRPRPAGPGRVPAQIRARHQGGFGLHGRGPASRLSPFRPALISRVGPASLRTGIDFFPDLNPKNSRPRRNGLEELRPLGDDLRQARYSARKRRFKS